MSIGLIGTGSMGSQLAINISKRSVIHVHNRTYSKVKKLADKNVNIEGHESLVDFVSNMKEPRTIITMLPHGTPSMNMIKTLTKHVSSDDIIINCANELYRNSVYIEQECRNRDVNYLGVGVSGGVNGALLGPAMMVGGDKNVYETVRPFFESIACNTVHISDDPGSGHFAKMVHNGVEYGMLQGIADVFAYCNYDTKRFESILREAKDTFLDGYLIDSAIRVCQTMPVNSIDGTCQMNNTGLWTQYYSLQQQINAPMISAGVQSRIATKHAVDKDVPKVKAIVHPPLVIQALHFVFSSSLLEGYAITDSKGFPRETVKKAWMKGTIIENDMVPLDTDMLRAIRKFSANGARQVCQRCIIANIPVPTLSNGITAYDFERNGNKSTAFVMAQRHDFGGHDINMNDSYM
tara:strand:+ start:14459 stop:15679 length:1221 start_codon:yes stop_codon:yes gene_type:complete